MSKLIRILKCDDPKKWYANKIGEIVEFSGIVSAPEDSGGTEYRCRDDSGYINFIPAVDAFLYEVIDDTKYPEPPAITDDRFDLEERLTDCWDITSDLKCLYEYIGDHAFFRDMSGTHQDEIINIMIGLEKLYNVKFERLSATMEQCIANGTLK
tara:strand:- start:104 stop:565 length:462 start_codon:yes stop_codon:yes gene_type:complete